MSKVQSDSSFISQDLEDTPELLPMQHEINLRKLAFLHHILNLDDDDPVKKVFRAEQRLEFEPNWANEIKRLIQDLNLTYDENNIKSKTKQQWKSLIKSAVTTKALDELNSDCLSKKKTSKVPRYELLKKQPYFDSLHPSKARILFKIRAFVYDIKSNRSYAYKDEICRLCGGEKEDTFHILNDCKRITRSVDVQITDIYDLSSECMHEIVNRFLSFQTQVDKIGT